MEKQVPGVFKIWQPKKSKAWPRVGHFERPYNQTRTRNMCCWISFRNCWYCCTFGFSPTSSTYATWAKGGIFLRCPKNKETVQIKKWMVLLMEEIWLTTWDIWNLANVITYQPQVVSRISKHQQYLEKKHNNHWQAQIQVSTSPGWNTLKQGKYRI